MLTLRWTQILWFHNSQHPECALAARISDFKLYHRRSSASKCFHQFECIVRDRDHFTDLTCGQCVHSSRFSVAFPCRLNLTNVYLKVTICGYYILHWCVLLAVPFLTVVFYMLYRFEVIIWIPNVVAFIVLLSVGGTHLVAVPNAGLTPVTPAIIFNFAATLAGSVISWAPITPDYGIYHTPEAST